MSNHNISRQRKPSLGSHNNLVSSNLADCSNCLDRARVLPIIVIVYLARQAIAFHRYVWEWQSQVKRRPHLALLQQFLEDFSSDLQKPAHIDSTCRFQGLKLSGFWCRDVHVYVPSKCFLRRCPSNIQEIRWIFFDFWGPLRVLGLTHGQWFTFPGLFSIAISVVRRQVNLGAEGTQHSSWSILVHTVLFGPYGTVLQNENVFLVQKVGK